MGMVQYDLSNSSTLAGWAPAPDGAGGFGDAMMPVGLEGPGIYVIWNQNTNNRYIGISNNLAERFAPRMSVVTELGFDDAEMGNIIVFWGDVFVTNTAGGGPQGLADYIGPLVANIDGHNFNLEHLLIRYFLEPAGFGGTVSNNVYANTPFVNSTANAMDVEVIWGGDAMDMDQVGHTLAPGAQW